MEEIVLFGELCRVCLIKSENMKHLDVGDDHSLIILKRLSSICNLDKVGLVRYLKYFKLVYNYFVD